MGKTFFGGYKDCVCSNEFVSGCDRAVHCTKRPKTTPPAPKGVVPDKPGPNIPPPPPPPLPPPKRILSEDIKVPTRKK